MSMKQAMGQFFARYRLEAGLNVEKAAELLGIESSSVLAQYENGSLTIPLDHVFSMANLYNVPPDLVVQMFYELSHERAEQMQDKRNVN